ncbi:unnamed protein product [Prorocentrum cordatum]|uniref:Uncharacterized protein n=1 Tax=Prorocentrum cordatum TaxID=2364126 RepID=A0ABN9R5A5_9DINO|nr:unnamed protein product [Polarella glacialis]
MGPQARQFQKALEKTKPSAVVEQPGTRLETKFEAKLKLFTPPPPLPRPTTSPPPLDRRIYRRALIVGIIGFDQAWFKPWQSLDRRFPDQDARFCHAPLRPGHHCGDAARRGAPR